MSTEDTQILLSIAIPTKNRQAYLMNLVDELLKSESRNFEIIIQDNSENDQLSQYIAGLEDDRIRYSYYAEWISVVDNCDAAIRACSGHYVCMLGDDDGILVDESLNELRQAKSSGVDGLMSSVLLYTWPDLSHHMFSDFGGKLYLKPLKSGFRGKSVLEKAKNVVAHSGALGLEGLPCVYHGFISRKVLQAVEKRTGSYFPGPSPDMANAIGISGFLKQYHWTAAPLVISGHSAKSTAGQGTRKMHHGEIAAQSHLPADTVSSWYPQIPFYWSGPTIYAQSLRSAIDRTGINVIGEANDAFLYTVCFIFERPYFRQTLKAIRQSEQKMWLLLPQMIYYAFFIIWKRSVQFIANLGARLFPKKRTVNAKSIADAIIVARKSKNHYL